MLFRSRTGDYALGGVFHADHAELGRAGGGGVKDFIEAVAINQLGGAAEIFDASLLAKSALRPQHGHAGGHFQRQAGRHDFAPDAGDMVIEQRPLAIF